MWPVIQQVFVNMTSHMVDAANCLEVPDFNRRSFGNHILTIKMSVRTL